MLRVSKTAATLVLVLSGCGEATPDAAAPTGGSEPVTARALAAVAAERAGTPDRASREEDAAEEFDAGGVGAELRYGSDGEDDGDALVVATGRGVPGLVDCGDDSERLDGCVVTERGTLAWEEAVPESDPGVVYVVVDKGRTGALLFYTGPEISGDPRDLDLPIPAEALLEIADDPRVDTTTSSEAVAAGEALPYWRQVG
jgi:hypothetical protein